jgi:CBS domain-containing protein
MTRTQVGHHMLRAPLVLPAAATVADVHDLFASPHVHMALLTSSGAVGGRLLSTLTREDLGGAAPGGPARPLGRLEGRTMGADLTAEDARLALLENGIRRAAVVDDDGLLLGLLCLKRHGNGVCTDAGGASRR